MPTSSDQCVFVCVWHDAVQVSSGGSKKDSTAFVFLTLKCMCLSILMFLSNYSAYDYPPALFCLPSFKGPLFLNPNLAEH